ncbi:hypothetical protein AAG906_033964 [Vitis piasezkii]
MSTTGSTERASDDIIDASTPLLGNAAEGRDDDRSRRSVRRQSLREAARFLRRASSRRMMREPSMLVRETAAEQLEERQSDWAYSKPVVVLDMIWNFAFVVVAAAVLVLSRRESPSMPLRFWIVGYALQCILHIVCVSVEYRRRRRRAGVFGSEDDGIGSGGSYSSSPQGDSSQYVTLASLGDESSTSSVAKHLESANTMFSFIWWIIGFYWVSAGGQALARDSPQLYWLCIIFWVLMCSLLFSALHWHVSLELLFVAVFHVSLQFYMLWLIRKEHLKKTLINFQGLNSGRLVILRKLMVTFKELVEE